MVQPRASFADFSSRGRKVSRDEIPKLQAYGLRERKVGRREAVKLQTACGRGRKVSRDEIPKLQAYGR